MTVSRFCRHHGKKHIHRTAHEREVGALHRRPGLMPVLYRAGFRASRLENVTLINHVPFAEVQRLFDRAKVFVNTSEQEGFPNTFIQAGLGRTPIVSLRVDPDGMIERTGCGYVCSDAEKEMARAVGTLLRDEGERRRRGSAAFDYVKERHDLAKVVEEFKGMLRELTEKG